MFIFFCSMRRTNHIILYGVTYIQQFNTLRPRQNGRHFPDDTFKCIFLNENVRILFKISLKFVHKGPINNIPAMVQIMPWRCPGDKPLSEPMVVSSPTHICVTRPQWVKTITGECYFSIHIFFKHLLIYNYCCFQYLSPIPIDMYQVHIHA